MSNALTPLQELDITLAKFMGAQDIFYGSPELPYAYLTLDKGTDDERRLRVDSLKYRYSWDWLLPVYRKAKKEIKSRSKKNRVDYSGPFLVDDAGKAILKGDCKLAASYLAQAITWHDQGKEVQHGS